MGWVTWQRWGWGQVWPGNREWIRVRNGHPRRDKGNADLHRGSVELLSLRSNKPPGLPAKSHMVEFFFSTFTPTMGL